MISCLKYFTKLFYPLQKAFPPEYFTEYLCQLSRCQAVLVTSLTWKSSCKYALYFICYLILCLRLCNIYKPTSPDKIIIKFQSQQQSHIVCQINQFREKRQKLAKHHRKRTKGRPQIQA